MTGDSVSREAVLVRWHHMAHTEGVHPAIERRVSASFHALPAVEPECVARIGEDGVTAIETGSLRCGCRMHAVHRCGTRWSDMEASAKARTPAEPVSEAAVALAEADAALSQHLNGDRAGEWGDWMDTAEELEAAVEAERDRYEAAKEAADAAVLRERSEP